MIDDGTVLILEGVGDDLVDGGTVLMGGLVVQIVPNVLNKSPGIRRTQRQQTAPHGGRFATKWIEI